MLGGRLGALGALAGLFGVRHSGERQWAGWKREGQVELREWSVFKYRRSVVDKRYRWGACASTTCTCLADHSLRHEEVKHRGQVKVIDLDHPVATLFGDDAFWMTAQSHMSTFIVNG